MWEAGGVIDHGGGGHHEALLLQAAAHGGGEVHGHGPGLLPWLQGPAAAATAGPPYMSVVVPPRHLTQAAPPPFGGDHQPGEDETFAVAGGGYYCVEGDGGGVGHHHQYGMFGLEPPPAPATTSSSLHHMGRGSRVLVSGLLGTLQAELGRMTAKEIMDAKALAASRSHSEAERRRRQRINGHLARLRSLLPNTTKTDKASLLAEVIDHVKELKRQTSAMMAAGEAAPAPEQLLLPTEADELAVEAGADEEGRLVARASLCCEDRADLIPDIARALAALRLRARRAEIATLGGRVRSVLLIAAVEEEADDNRSDDGDGDRDGGEDNGCDDDGCGRVVAASHRRHELVASIQEALRGVIDRKAASSDTSSSGGGGGGGGSGSTKRQRMNGAHDQGSFYLAGNSS